MSTATPPPGNGGTAAEPAAEARKKRRFFAAKLPTLPLVSAVSTSKPTVVSSDKVLAALLPPRSVEPPPRIERPRREVRDRVDAVSDHDLPVPPKPIENNADHASAKAHSSDSPVGRTAPSVMRTIKIRPLEPGGPWRTMTIRPPKPRGPIETSEGNKSATRTNGANGGSDTAASLVSPSTAVVKLPRASATPVVASEPLSTPAAKRPTSRWWKTTVADTPAVEPPTISNVTKTSSSTTIKLTRTKGPNTGPTAKSPTAKSNHVADPLQQRLADAQGPSPSLSSVKSTKIKLKRGIAPDQGAGAKVPATKVMPDTGRQKKQASTGDLSMHAPAHANASSSDAGQAKSVSPARQVEDDGLPAELRGAVKHVPIKLKQPPRYYKIAENVFPERGRQKARSSNTCSCDLVRGCGMNCQHRASRDLCGPECSCSGKCENTSLAKRKNPLTAVVYTGSRGFGLLAMKDITMGEFVIDYRGEVITNETFQERCRNEYANNTDFYALAYDETEVIDAGLRGNEARFINHGCNPNLEVRRYSLKGNGLDESEVGLWALRDISAGEELFYDYNLAVFDSNLITDERIVCRCGDPECVGYLGRVSGLRSILSHDDEADIEPKPARKKRKHKSLPAPPMAMSDSITVVGPRHAIALSTASTSSGHAAPTRVKKKLILRASMPSQSAVAREAAEDDAALERIDHAAETDPDERIVAENPPKQKKKRRAINANPLLPRVKRPKRGEVLGLPSPFTHVPLSPLHHFQAPQPEEVVEETFARLPTSPSQRDLDGRSSSPPQRMSGWADWLVRKAGERPRTLEQWQDFAIQRRRGKEWKEKMMELFGVAPYEGGPRLPWDPEQESLGPGCSLPKRGPVPKHMRPQAPPQEGEAGPSSASGDMRDGMGESPSADYVDEEIDELDPSEASSGHEEEDRKPFIPPKTPTPKKTPQANSKAPQRPLFSSTPVGSIAAGGHLASSSQPVHPQPTTSLETPRAAGSAALWPIFAQSRPTPANEALPPPIEAGSSTSSEALAAARAQSPLKLPTEKKQAIAKRNGAPMGWAYVPVTIEPAAAAAADDIGPRSARKARATNLKDDDRRKSFPGRR